MKTSQKHISILLIQAFLLWHCNKGIQNELNIQNGPEIKDYQLGPLNRIYSIIKSSYGEKRKNITILDSGCDPSGKQMYYFSKITSNRVVGISPEKNFPSEAAKEFCKGNCELLSMDGMDLKFPDQSFDVVISNNVLEHVRNPDQYLKEIQRVLKPDGLAIIEFYPVWTSPRGHHVHPDMVEGWGYHQYKNDGSTIKDWSHLVYDRKKMDQELRGKLPDPIRDKVVEYIYADYTSNGLNRTGWSKIESSIKKYFPKNTIQIRRIDVNDASLKPKDSTEDYTVGGAFIIGSSLRNINF